MKKLRQRAVHPQQSRGESIKQIPVQPNQTGLFKQQQHTISSLKHTSLFPSAGPAFFPQSICTHAYTPHVRKIFGQMVGSCKAVRPCEGVSRNTGLRGSRGSRCRYMGQLCQVERSSLVFPGARGSAECEGIKTSPGLFALIIDSEARLSQRTWITDGLFSPAAEIT